LTKKKLKYASICYSTSKKFANIINLIKVAAPKMKEHLVGLATLGYMKNFFHEVIGILREKSTQVVS